MTVLPLVRAPINRLYGVSTSGDLIAYAYDVVLQLHRSPDSVVVRELPSGGRLSGRLFLPGPPTGLGASEVVAQEPATGQQVWRIAVPVGDSQLATGELGVVTRREADGMVHVLQPDGSDHNTGLAGSTWQPVLAQDRRTVALADPDDVTVVHLLDVASAESVSLAVRDNRFVEVQLAPGRVYIGDSVRPQGLTWWGRDGLMLGRTTLTVPAPGDQDLVLGDGLVRVHGIEGGYEIRRVDLADGSVGDSLLPSVGQVAQGEDGALVLVRNDTISGRVERLASDLSTTPFGDLPQLYRSPLTTAVAADHAVVSYSPDGYVPIHRTSLDSGSVVELSTGRPVNVLGTVVNLSDTLVNAAGDAVLTRGTEQFTVTSPQTTRSFYGQFAWLEPGGLLYRNTENLGVMLRRVDTGEVVVPNLRTDQAVDGGMLWTGPDRQGSFERIDLLGGAAPLRIPTGFTCANSYVPVHLQVVGRWAMVACPLSDGGRVTTAVDLGGSEGPWLVNPPSPGLARLGDGFVVQADGPSSAPTGLRVTDLQGSHAERIYPRLPGWGPSDWQVSTDGRRRLIFTDGLAVKVADLSWVTAGLAADRTAPHLVSLSGSPTPTADLLVQASWQFDDGATNPFAVSAGIAGYETRQRVVTPGQDLTGWSAPVFTTSTTVSRVSGPLDTTCWEVRAQDLVGNQSGWSPEQCITVDTQPPVVITHSAGPSLTATPSRTTVRFAFEATDTVAVASYDVQLRAAAAGQALVTARPAAWQGTTAHAVSTSVPPGGEACFSVRARDELGQLSAWSPTSCVTVPFDDRALAASGAVTRGVSGAAFGGTLTRLERPGSSLRTTRQSTGRLAVLLMRGPRPGYVEVLVGAVRVARINCSGMSSRRVMIVFRAPSGVVQIRSTSGSCLVDGVGVLRP